MNSEDLEKHIEDRAGLAACHAGDGSWYSAARVLKELAMEVQALAEAKTLAEEGR